MPYPFARPSGDIASALAAIRDLGASFAVTNLIAEITESKIDAIMASVDELDEDTREIIWDAIAENEVARRLGTLDVEWWLGSNGTTGVRFDHPFHASVLTAVNWGIARRSDMRDELDAIERVSALGLLPASDDGLEVLTRHGLDPRRRVRRAAVRALESVVQNTKDMSPPSSVRDLVWSAATSADFDRRSFAVDLLEILYANADRRARHEEIHGRVLEAVVEALPRLPAPLTLVPAARSILPRLVEALNLKERVIAIIGTAKKERGDVVGEALFFIRALGLREPFAPMLRELDRTTKYVWIKRAIREIFEGQPSDPADLEAAWRRASAEVRLELVRYLSLPTTTEALREAMKRWLRDELDAQDEEFAPSEIEAMFPSSPVAPFRAVRALEAVLLQPASIAEEILGSADPAAILARAVVPYPLDAWEWGDGGTHPVAVERMWLESPDLRAAVLADIVAMSSFPLGRTALRLQEEDAIETVAQRFRETVHGQNEDRYQVMASLEALGGLARRRPSPLTEWLVELFVDETLFAEDRMRAARELHRLPALDRWRERFERTLNDPRPCIRAWANVLLARSDAGVEPSYG